MKKAIEQIDELILLYSIQQDLTSSPSTRLILKEIIKDLKKLRLKIEKLNKI
jgi:hypothetical protein